MPRGDSLGISSFGDVETSALSGERGDLRDWHELAVRHGYLLADEHIFAADRGIWYWAIQDRHFAAANGILY